MCALLCPKLLREVMSMNSRSIGLAFGIGAVLSAAWFVPACSSETAGTSDATTSTVSSTSATSSSSSSSSSSTTVSSTSGVMMTMCGTETCSAVSLPIGGISLPACCPDSDPLGCGLDITMVASFVGLPPGCLETDRPGPLDPNCPDVTVNIPMLGMMVLPGCC